VAFLRRKKKTKSKLYEKQSILRRVIEYDKQKVVSVDRAYQEGHFGAKFIKFA
jgi:hypothetical protein